MIIVRIFGGLGNQMFQYAFARSLAETHGTELLLDLSQFDSDQKRSFALDQFLLDVNKLDGRLLAKVKLIRNLGRLRSLVPHRRLLHLSYYKEPHFHFDSSALDIGANAYLEGYFQSEKYFVSQRNVIRKCFTFKRSTIEKVMPFARQLRTQNSVAIHVRRGDYAEVSQTKRKHGLTPMSYYQKAAGIVRSRVQDPRLYIFTDDIPWVNNRPVIENSTLVSGQISRNHCEDLYLMAQCRHQIIANSTFSWWGAWLNEYPDKFVIAPAKWFDQSSENTRDLLPDTWLKI